MDGEVRYVAKKPYRHTISWQQLHNRGLVYGRVVEIKGQRYLVRLMQGGNTNPTANTNGFDVTAGVGSEWNRLFYRIHGTTHIDTRNITVSEDSPVSWVDYSDEDLLMHYNNGNGTYCWTQETHGTSSGYRVLRGYFGVSYLSYDAATGVTTGFGWRPVLVPVK